MIASPGWEHGPRNSWATEGPVLIMPGDQANGVTRASTGVTSIV
jgi:hypothetical protein